MAEAAMTEIEERIVEQRERSERLQRELECECPERCTLDHDN